MAGQARSVRVDPGVVVRRIECAWCGLTWNRRPTRGQTPRFRSPACRNANYRNRVQERTALQAADEDHIASSRQTPGQELRALMGMTNHELNEMAESDPAAFCAFIDNLTQLVKSLPA